VPPLSSTYSNRLYTGIVRLEPGRLSFVVAFIFGPDGDEEDDKREGGDDDEEEVEEGDENRVGSDDDGLDDDGLDDNFDDDDGVEDEGRLIIFFEPNGSLSLVSSAVALVS
jgi:hypothetical protein